MENSTDLACLLSNAIPHSNNPGNHATMNGNGGSNGGSRPIQAGPGKHNSLSEQYASSFDGSHFGNGVGRLIQGNHSKNSTPGSSFNDTYGSFEGTSPFNHPIGRAIQAPQQPKAIPPVASSLPHDYLLHYFSNGRILPTEHPNSLTPPSSSPPDGYRSSEKSSPFGDAMNAIGQRKQPNELPGSSLGLGPIARPRSYSTSASYHSSTRNSYNPIGSAGGEGILSSILKMSEESREPLNGSSSYRSGSANMFSENSNLSRSPLLGLTSNPGGNNSGGMFAAPGFTNQTHTVESVVASALEDLKIDDIHLESTLEKDLSYCSQRLFDWGQSAGAQQRPQGKKPECGVRGLEMNGPAK